MRSYTLALVFGGSFALAVAGMSSAQSSGSSQASKTGSAAQQKQSTTVSQSKPSASSSSKEVGPDTAVITVKGMCPTPAARPKTGTTAAKAAPCQTVITKAQLEKLIETVRPNLPPAQRKPLAEQYVELLTFADSGTKAGLEKDSKVQEQLQLSRMQVLARAYTQQLQKQTAEVSETDTEKYYNENPGKFEEAKLLRIYIPTPTTAEGKPADAAATKALAEKIQKSAAAGEDFEKLQKEAYAEANNKSTPPSVDMGERRRGTLPPKQEETVFQLKPGEVSPVLEEASGAYIYKVISKDKAPLDKVKEEIKSTLGRERFREAMEKLRASAKPTFNEAYFAAGTPPAGAAPAQPAPGAAGPSAASPQGTPGSTPQASAPSPQAPSATTPQAPVGPAQPAQPSTPPAEGPQTPPPAAPPSK